MRSATRATSPSLCEIRIADDALRTELEQEIEQGRAVALVEAGDRLVQNQEPHLLGQRFCNFHQLLLADPDIGDQRVRRLIGAHFASSCRDRL